VRPPPAIQRRMLCSPPLLSPPFPDSQKCVITFTFTGAQVTIRNMKQLVRLVEDYLERHKATQTEAATSAAIVAPLDGDTTSQSPSAPPTTTTTAGGDSDSLTLDAGHPPSTEAAQPEQPHDSSPPPPPSIAPLATADGESVAVTTTGASDDGGGAAQPEPSQAPSEQLLHAQPDTSRDSDKGATEAEMDEKKEMTNTTTTSVFESPTSPAACAASASALASTTFLRFDVGERNSVIVLDTAFVVREEAAILATHSIAHPKSTDLFASSTES